MCWSILGATATAAPPGTQNFSPGIIPEPDLVILLDADEFSIAARKCEVPLPRNQNAVAEISKAPISARSKSRRGHSPRDRRHHQVLIPRHNRIHAPALGRPHTQVAGSFVTTDAMPVKQTVDCETSLRKALHASPEWIRSLLQRLTTQTMTGAASSRHRHHLEQSRIRSSAELKITASRICIALQSCRPAKNRAGSCRCRREISAPASSISTNLFLPQLV